MDPFRPDLSHSWLISPNAARLLAMTFGLTVADIRTDARDVAAWHWPNDDDLVSSIAARRGLEAGSAAIYVRILRTMLTNMPPAILPRRAS